MAEEINLSQVNLCWYVGAVWNDTDMTDKFITEGYWENGWDDKFKILVNQIQIGDKIAIKSSYTQKNNLPFDINNGTASVMSIKCVGTVTKNYNNGKRVDVNWSEAYAQRNWFFFTGRTTIWKVERNPDDWMFGALLDFTFSNTKQNYDAFLAHPYWANKYKLQKNTSELKYIDLIEKYKLFFKKNKKAAFDGEIYKWKLLAQNKGKKDVDLINAVRTSNNLIYQSDAATLKTLVEQFPSELVQIVDNLLDESSDLIIRLENFRNDMKALVQKNLTSTNYAEDERTAADYLTYSYPEKYTFYTNEIYNAYCKYLEIEKRKTGEIYPHYCELLHKLENFVSKDDELLEMIANNSSDYIQSDLLLSQNIVYVMLKENYLSQINEGDYMLDKLNEYKTLLLNTHNLILHGAPGTGKTHLARDIADAMGCSDNEIGFVQFHPSYDYTDFIEGLRPVENDDGQIGFERKDGVFKKFCERALEKIDASDFDKAYDKLLESFSDNEKKELKTPSGSIFGIVPNTKGNLSLLTGKEFSANGVLTKERIKAEWQNNPIDKWWQGYYRGVVNYLKNYGLKEYDSKIQSNNVQKKYVFIIDEINRGEMSKIFGELFFSIDPGYRGEEGKIQTQYQNLVLDGEFKAGFYVPENVYIIGTMNDIDRNVESMDFAFRRRFTFKEITATDTQQDILAGLDDSIREEAINRMNSLNDAILNIEGLSSAYHIGGAYFLKLKDLNNDFAQLWNYHLKGLLREYLRGMEDVETNIKKLEEAYNLKNVADSSKEVIENS